MIFADTIFYLFISLRLINTNTFLFEQNNLIRFLWARSVFFFDNWIIVYGRRSHNERIVYKVIESKFDNKDWVSFWRRFIKTLDGLCWILFLDFFAKILKHEKLKTIFNLPLFVNYGIVWLVKSIFHCQKLKMKQDGIFL